MARRERGVVVEERGSSAIVRLPATPACEGCASAGPCRGAGGGGDRLAEAINAVGARSGDAVELVVDAGPRLGAAARRWLPPLLGLLLGAAAAQLAAAAVLGPEAGTRAAGLGGIAGAVAGALLGRRIPKGSAAARPPRIARVLGRDVAVAPR